MLTKSGKNSRLCILHQRRNSRFETGVIKWSDELMAGLPSFVYILYNSLGKENVGIFFTILNIS
jgi:hypothetical protein